MADLKLGADAVAVFKGSDSVKAMYFGDVLVYPSGVEVTLNGQADLDLGEYITNVLGVTSGNVTITLDGIFYASSTAKKALSITNVPFDVTLKVILLSTTRILGAGGAGASSGGSWSSYLTSLLNSNDAAVPEYRYRYIQRSGGAGGDALYVRSPCTIVHSSAQIYGGGGGGGMTRLGWRQQASPNFIFYEGGGGGGGGQGYVGGSGGTRDSVTKSADNSSFRITGLTQSSNGGAGSESGAGSGGSSGKTDAQLNLGFSWGLWGSWGHAGSLSQAKAGGGTPRVLTGSGGKGGAWGAAGSASVCYPTAYDYYHPTNRAGAGGAGGRAIDGNANIVWEGYNAAYVKGSVV